MTDSYVVSYKNGDSDDVRKSIRIAHKIVLNADNDRGMNGKHDTSWIRNYMLYF